MSITGPNYGKDWWFVSDLENALALVDELRRYLEVSPGSWPRDELEKYVAEVDERIAALPRPAGKDEIEPEAT